MEYPAAYKQRGIVRFNILSVRYIHFTISASRSASLIEFFSSLIIVPLPQRDGRPSVLPSALCSTRYATGTEFSPKNPLSPQTLPVRLRRRSWWSMRRWRWRRYMSGWRRWWWSAASVIVPSVSAFPPSFISFPMSFPFPSSPISSKMSIGYPLVSRWYSVIVRRQVEESAGNSARIKIGPGPVI
jgi:hypothetical protein